MSKREWRRLHGDYTYRADPVSDEEQALYPRWASLVKMAERAIRGRQVVVLYDSDAIAQVEVPTIEAVAWGNKPNQTIRVRSE
jgi:hypothetical protein